ncbi:hypothetical protein JCGZ_15431 [Jatropha curcas]|uniref:Dynamin stalk domain-containing protein n=1 Tax=Jatropha curcas TaxID=180498 RepID=A0A067KGT8_JATCU|nr:hypothetical protein JCGZ_15431 [Jatropha curcas]
MPKPLSSPADAMTAFLGIVGSARESLRKILVRGECDEYSDDHNMHCTARLVEMLNEYSNDLHHCPKSDPTRNFLMEEIHILEESRGIELPNFLPRTAFLSMLQKKLGCGLEGMLEESPSVASKREKLNMRIKLLGESKTVLGNIKDEIATTYLDS